MGCIDSMVYNKLANEYIYLEQTDLESPTDFSNFLRKIDNDRIEEFEMTMLGLSQFTDEGSCKSIGKIDRSLKTKLFNFLNKLKVKILDKTRRAHENDGK